MTTHAENLAQAQQLAKAEGVNYASLTVEQRREYGQRARFEAIMRQERQVDAEAQSVRLGDMFRTTVTSWTSKQQDGREAALARNKAKLSAMLDALSLEELRAYGEYRKQALASR